VGLGNPGSAYSGTRHNLGFVALDELAREERLAWSHSRKHESEVASWNVTSRAATATTVHLAKPLTFMNLSGKAVRSLADYYQLEPRSILVVCDDCSLPLGDLRLRRRGSPGGHNGLESVAEHLKSNDFPRIRLGIGPRPPGIDLSDHVLSRFRPEEKSAIDRLTSRAVLAIRATLFFSLEKAMNEFNRKQSDS
jgi:PTH1 family peptidyl-tRNA hydrolase